MAVAALNVHPILGSVEVEAAEVTRNKVQASLKHTAELQTQETSKIAEGKEGGQQKWSPRPECVLMFLTSQYMGSNQQQVLGQRVGREMTRVSQQARLR